MTSRRARARFLAGLGAALTIGLVVAARPGRIFDLVRRTESAEVALAFALLASVLVLRALRLMILLNWRIAGGDALGVSSVAQLAAALAPLRLGELAFVPLLHHVGVKGTLRALSFLVVARVLDLGTLLVWAAAAAVSGGRSPIGATFWLAAVVVGAWVGSRAALVTVRTIAGPWRRAGGLRRRALGQFLRVRSELRLVIRRPWHATAVTLLSLISWGPVWLLTIILIRSMGLGWSPHTVLLAVIGGSLGATLPLNVAGNFGTLEAGWTAAVAVAGVPAGEALAAGFAVHLWGLLFNIALGVVGMMLLVRRNGPRFASMLRAMRRL